VLGLTISLWRRVIARSDLRIPGANLDNVPTRPVYLFIRGDSDSLDVVAGLSLKDIFRHLNDFVHFHPARAHALAPYPAAGPCVWSVTPHGVRDRSRIFCAVAFQTLRQWTRTAISPAVADALRVQHLYGSHCYKSQRGRRLHRFPSARPRPSWNGASGELRLVPMRSYAAQKSGTVGELERAGPLLDRAMELRCGATRNAAAAVPTE